jgi:hypothetical protein
MASNPISMIINATGPSAPIALDWMQNPFNATLQVFLNGTATFGVEYTLDNIMTTPPANVRWVPNSAALGLAPASTAGGTAQYTTPVCAVRVNPTALTGTLELRVVQS